MRHRVSSLALALVCVVLSGCSAVKLTTEPAKLQITSSSSALRAGEEMQFSVNGTNGVTWRVNGIPGGNATVGTISPAGNYRAPAEPPSPNTVSISAGSGTTTSELEIAILNPLPVIANASVAPSGDTMSITVSGSGLLRTSRANIGGAPVETTFVSASQLTVSAASREGDFTISIANPEPGAAESENYVLRVSRAGRPTRVCLSTAAARLLDQATFGVTDGECGLLGAQMQAGATAAISNWVDSQEAAPQSAWVAVTSVPTAVINGNTAQLCGQPTTCAQITWFQNSLAGQDQLRQRMAFALSQIWVTSGITVQQADSLLTWYRILNNNAFGNYRTLMEDVTLSSAMGLYLDMGNSAKPITGNIANENYARELLQLFTVGLYRLNDDGTYQLDENNQPIPSYTEPDVQNFARVFTGWTYKRTTGTQDWNRSFNSTGTDRTAPMAEVPSQHDTGSKTLFESTPQQVVIAQNTSPTTATMQAELDQALDAIFNHPNLPPFVSKQLIQKFVTSNPSPAYINRVTQVFKNNGSGVRGDLKAVIKAILSDPEARAGDSVLAYDSSGHLREPVLYVTGMLRGLGYARTNEIVYTNAQGQTMTNFAVALPGQAAAMGQNVLFSPSVFNYYSPEYALPTNNTLLAPEFQLLTSATAPIRANFVDLAVRTGGLTGSAIDVSGAVDGFAAMATSSPSAMVERMSQRFMRGQMSTAMRDSIVSSVNGLTAGSTSVADANNRYRARMALYLILTSSQYQVIH